MTRSAAAKKQRSKLDSSPLLPGGQWLSWVQTSKDRDGSDLWSWMTSRRVISELQQQHEDQEERSQIEVYKNRFYEFDDDKFEVEKASTDSKSSELQKSHDSKAMTTIPAGEDVTETEKMKAKSSWDSAQMNRAFDLTGRDKVALTGIMTVAIAVRFWRISWPDEVVLDEVNTGKMINRYLTGEFAFDAHPPLGTMIMAGVATLSKYNGTFDFDDIGDLYPGALPFVSMRLAMSFLGALCAPMAYVTLKSAGQSAPAAILAAIMVTFDNALVSSNRLMTLDAPMMFFTSATLMSWNLFNKQAPSPFSIRWWLWLLATGIAMTGAMAVKLAGITSVVAIAMFSVSSMCNMAFDSSVTSRTWSKHLMARAIALIFIPIFLYTMLFRLHFEHQSYEPSDLTSARVQYDLSLLSKPYRQSLIPKPRNAAAMGEETEEEEKEKKPLSPTLSDIVFGSVVQLQSDDSGVYLHSTFNSTPSGSKQQQLGGYEHSDLNSHWIVIRAATAKSDKEEIPSRLQYVKNGDLIRLRHVPTRLCLHSHGTRSYSNNADLPLFEVTAYGAYGYDGDANDWWIIETVDPITQLKHPKEDGTRVKTFESTFRLRHLQLNCYLFATGTALPEPWGQGRQELACRLDARIRPKALWRFTMNLHDYLPEEAEVAAFPTLSFWQKFVEIHRMMWGTTPLAERSFRSAAAHPIRWPVAQAMIHAWAGYRRQITIIGNPVVWGTAAFGLLTYLGLSTFFILREKRAYVETGLLAELKRFHVKDASTYFAVWSCNYLPFFFCRRTLLLHHYFPALYCSILITSSMISGLSSYLPRKGRFGLYAGLILLTLVMFRQLSPFSYGSAISREQCESISQWANKAFQGRHDVNELGCEPFPKTTSRQAMFSDIRTNVRAEKIMRKQHNAAKTAAAYMPAESNMPSLDGLKLPDGKQPKVARPESTKPAPKLPEHFPPTDHALPMQHLIMVGPQLPPQYRNMEIDF